MTPRPSRDQWRRRASVERAADDLRRGEAVVLGLSESEAAAVLVLPVENLSDAALAQASAWSGDSPALALTRRRAAVLALNLDQDNFATADKRPAAATVLALPPGPSVGDILAFADPTTPAAAGPYGHLPPGDMPVQTAASALILMRMAGLMPAALLFPLAVKPGGAAAWAGRRGLLHAAGGDIQSAAAAGFPDMAIVARARLPLPVCETVQVSAFRSADGRHEHYAVEVGTPNAGQPVLMRIHSQCFTGDVLGSLRCDCGGQLQAALAAMAKAGGGLLLYLLEEGRGIGLASKLKAYRLQDHGFDTFEANRQLGYEDDERNFAAAAAMLRTLGIKQVRLMTNNPRKVAALAASGIDVTERVALPPADNPHNADYLQAKSNRGGHLF